ncbi:hypothetical protein H4R21_002357 [Coemansia helicoidea]|uniref:Uncharacterized protein n=1 Tax=Coemansia helicoidea TaxID=1286919 RepID=A0ACC1L787_9FUNG|nr:hypothetical protein H4R21_002357 [Coemansia helicoidea]
MLLCNLPEDILAIVLGWCVGAGYNAAYDLKDNLPLLAVCRLWRRLAIPLVYNHVFVQFGDDPNHGAGVLPRSLDEDELTDVAVKTNLDLVAVVGCARAVKRVHIDVHCLVNPFPGWRSVIERMRSVASKWRVVELMVAMHPDFTHFDHRSVDLGQYADDIIEVGDALAALMPGVRRLAHDEVYSNPIAWSLYGRLASHYADQLERLCCQQPIAVPLGCKFTRLRGFHMNLNHAANYQLPQVTIGEVANMSLFNGPPNHSWAPFSTDSDSWVIEFPKLRRLWAAYHTTYVESDVVVRHRDGHPWKLHFPSLENLDIHCTQYICPLLEYAVLPPRMESIYIEMTSTSYLDIANVVLPATKRLTLCVTRARHGGPSGLPTINRILESARGSESMALLVEDEWLPVTPAIINCAALTHLEVLATTGVDDMLAFIQGLPKLAKLAFRNLDLSDIHADLSNPEADEDTAVAPLSTSLECLAIGHDMERHSPDAAVAVVEYVLLRVPTLAKLTVAQTPERQVTDFVGAYSLRHPHLSGIQLRFDGGSDPSITMWDVGA